MPKFTLKRNDDDLSDSIILSFQGKWIDQVLEGTFSVEFRKNGPRNVHPDCLYAYVGSPIKAIVVRRQVTRYELIGIEEAVELSGGGLLSADDLRTYASPRTQLYVFELGPVCIARQPITLEYLASNYGYYPSSTYIPLSGTGKDTLDQLGQFQVNTE